MGLQCSSLCQSCCAVLSCFNHVWLSATPWTVTHKDPLSMEFSRQEYWSGLAHPPPGNLLYWGIKPVSLALAGRFFIAEPPGQPYFPAGCWLPNEGLLSTPGAGAELETFTCWDATAVPPTARQPRNCALSLWTCLFWTLCISAILQHVAFCDQLLSLSTMFSRALCAIEGTRTPLPSMAEEDTTVWIHYASCTHYWWF